MSNQIRQNYHADCENAINDQINMELSASYVYLSMAYFFDRDDISLPGMSKFFKECSDEEKEHADKLMDFQIRRGAPVVLKHIPNPEKQEHGTALDALHAALDLEKKVNQSLLDIHKIASAKSDPHLTDFLEREYLDEQVDAIKKLGDFITQLKRTGAKDLGEYLFDKHRQ